MSNQRRSGRSRKKVNYSKFSDSSDDDFKEKNTLVTKKQKGEKDATSPKLKKSKAEKQEARVVLCDKPSRPSRLEKDSQKDLKATVQFFQDDDRKPKSEPDYDASNEVEAQVDQIQKEKEDECQNKLPNITESKCERKNEVHTEEEFDVSSEEDEKESSDESYSESDSSKKFPAKMKHDTRVTSVHSKRSTSQVKKQGIQTTKSKVVNYCSEQPLKLPTVKLRLGLSRKASIKPLHSTAKVLP